MYKGRTPAKIPACTDLEVIEQEIQLRNFAHPNDLEALSVQSDTTFERLGLGSPSASFILLVVKV